MIIIAKSSRDVKLFMKSSRDPLT